jgi:hypothetical protein
MAYTSNVAKIADISEPFEELQHCYQRIMRGKMVLSIFFHLSLVD